MTTALEDRRFEESVWRVILELAEPLPFENKVKIEFMIYMMKMYLHPGEYLKASKK